MLGDSRLVKPRDSIAVLAGEFESRNIDTSAPRFSDVWAAVATWLTRAVQCDSDSSYILFHSEPFLYIEFCRSFRHADDDQTFDLFVRLSCEQDGTPRFVSATPGTEGFATIADFIAHVEALEQFGVVRKFTGPWRLELFQC